MKSKKVIAIIAIVILVFGVGFFSYKFYMVKRPSNVRQAVFMSNGQVYFGYVANPKGQVVKLSDVYYLKTNDLTSSDVNKKIVLVKMGNELHQPQNTMFVNRDQIIFFQNLTDSSKINDAISKFVNNQTTSASTTK
ncbi:TPA: hypothetical protein DD449_02785 [Candidatus Berkelbacteria bacterium]|uniref:Uncharacterized protein n=1 Tax=Berkelbacteria bacterium GW2011_GWE1_39_12 TaxID=1618337 RepID=A0A0G4B370_9BACT|nr:MAG: hypothetical protein UT28_C0001G0214 [Berkelbacteria bacterium GW2011_GWE1_39_12]HBO60583.1 hypothetical protein [Candidatus Berkelbacteria bacterium]